MTVNGEPDFSSDSSQPVDFGTPTESGPFWTSGEAVPEPDQSDSSGPPDDSHPVTEAVLNGDADPEEEVLPAFDEQYRQDFIGLTFIGKLERHFTWMTHRFIIRTPTTEELIQVGLIHAKYQGTLADVKAYQAALVAVTLVTLDGQQLPVPITRDTDLLEERFNYVVKNWHPWTIDAVYQEYLLLEDRVVKVLDAMGKASGSAE